MSGWLAQYGLFVAEAITISVLVLVALGGLAVVLISIAKGVGQGRSSTHLEIRNVNEQLLETRATLDEHLLTEDGFKKARKQRKHELRDQEKADRKEERQRMFVLDFKGDIQASTTEALREEISAILQVAKAGDEVLVRLESAGGVVHGYGLAASQLRRLRDQKVKLTVAVDKVAASGGYLMACVADRIIAAPFAIIGSIGVVAQLPNLNRWLKKRDIDVELHTAGQYKRTLTVFGENSDEARAKFVAELDQTHHLFKAFVAENRPALSIEDVSTGEHWYGAEALNLGLVDELQTSDDYIMTAASRYKVYELSFQIHKSWKERLFGSLSEASARLPFGL